jgi:two-component system alkaline phosphatase synthesis response regulator PhoP
MPSVLIVEDDDSMAAALRDGFKYEGYSVSLARDGAAGLKAATEAPPDLIILDLMLPKMSGLDVCREIRKNGNPIPIIMLTARGQEIDKVLGLKMGADDYVTKPFGFLELMARVEAVLRRSAGKPVRLDTFHFGEIAVDFKKGQVRRQGKVVDLTPRELRLLQFFIEHQGEVVSREKLLDAVWGYDAAPLTRTVDMHVAKLRKKVEKNPADPRFILTIHGLGYRFSG